ncbi:hypothetical protein PHLCEN_2v2459 [Hermanssonia centrifuga]|uniref:Cytochrome P450 n=1 Tax=Hermanssonia centrifuga TaxID=98765 RepID=A0A2R6RLV4_9APHY|nr:hypothetical protein PHLCEN_2v2459 [Hermanssonia centrifuga]
MPTFNEELFSKLHEMAFLGNTKPTSLSQLTHCTIYNAYTRAIFGASFPVSTYQDFDYVDHVVHMLFLPLPSFVSPAHRARARLLRAFADYMKPWKETAGNRDVPNVSQQGNQIIRALVKSGLSDLDNAGLLQAYLWGAITNVVHITFWSIAHLMCDRTALDAVRKDVDETCEREFDDLNTLLGATPAMLHKSGFRLLDSLFKEAGRLHLLPTSVREVSDDVDIPLSSRGGFRAKRGSAVVVDIPAIHGNEEYFPDAESFRVDRFLDGESTKYLYVWGKGEHMVGLLLKDGLSQS